MLAARAVAEELLRSGTAHVAIAPGSRSGPLALACAAAFGDRVSVHADERSAAFFALGMARWMQAPAAALCTSGTAVANLLPAAVEADRARVPLLLLTADRPPELRGCGAPQTIDQAGLFAPFARASIELPVPEPTAPVLRATRAAMGRAVAATRGALPGPVHVNAPFREPLDPRPVEADAAPIGALAASDPLAYLGREGRPFAPALDARPAALEGAATIRLADALAHARRPLLVCGPDAASGPEEALALLSLARAAGAPLLADPLSGLRSVGVVSDNVMPAYDAVLRSERAADALLPDVVVLAGGAPVSRALARFLERSAAAGARHLAIDPGGRGEDPLHLGTEHLAGDLRALCRAATTSGRDAGAELDHWRRADAAARASLEASTAPPAAFFEGHVVKALEAALPDGALLFVGNSTPLRSSDTFLGLAEPFMRASAGEPRARLRILANRGASGIDGVVSSALGACLASGLPGALLVGDLSLLHDMGGLLAARRRAIPLAIVVVQNDGGAIFDHLPARAATPGAAFEALFTTPHGVTFAPLAALMGLPYHAVDGTAADAGPRLDAALSRALSHGTASIIEVALPRERSVRLHKRAWEAASRAAERAIASPAPPVPEEACA